MKTVKKLILGFIVIIFIFALVIGLYFLIPHLGLKPAESGQILNTNIYAIKNDESTVFFIKIGSDYIMFDTGTNAKKLVASLEEAGIQIDDVKWIFLTHSDPDHVAGLALFPHADIYMNADELPLLNGSKKRFYIVWNNSLPSGTSIDKITFIQNQIFSLNEVKIECIKAPGHTIGSMVYLVNDQYLFTGDAIKVSNGSVKIHPFTMDTKQGKRTIEQLRETINKSSVILTAHYGYYEKLLFD